MYQEVELFAKAIGLPAPWYVSDVAFSQEQGRLNITIDFPRGSTFACPVCDHMQTKAYSKA